MKILHIFDTAGVGSILAKYQQELGHDVKVLMGVQKYNPFSITEFYGYETIQEQRKYQFVANALKHVISFKPDIIHIHALWKIVPFVSFLKWEQSKIILHLHGTDLSYPFTGYKKIWRNLAFDIADYMILSTPDLIPLAPNSKCQYIPNPVDRAHFKPIRLPINGKGVTMGMSNLTFNGIEEKLRAKGFSHVDLYIHDRDKKPIPYVLLPKFLSGYEYYLDYKELNIPTTFDNKVLQAFSKTGLEALSMGLKVINYNFELIDAFPSEHEPLIVTEQVLDIYDKVLDKKKLVNPFTMVSDK